VTVAYDRHLPEEVRMNGLELAGKALVVIGAVTIALGGLLWLLSKVPWGSFWGHLPGDIIIERPGFTCAFPLVSSIIISLLLTVLLNLIVLVVRFLSQR